MIFVSEPEVRRIAVAMRDDRVGHQNPVDDREEAAEEGGERGEAKRDNFGHGVTCSWGYDP